MYNFKEKNKHLRNLNAANYAEVDLELLKKLDPRNQNISTFEHAPKRNAEKILYTLLDLTTAEEIRNNRRKVEQESLGKEAAEKAEQERLKQERLEKEATEQAEKERLEKEAAEKDEKLQEKEAELEAEKKSEPAPEVKKAPVSKATSSKKKTSTPKS
ncbi:MAG: hypothetical protein PHR52_11655, partial [Fermentimonas sp.]|nr:hypothetical protein [Fermentimonas sp.]